MQYLICRIPDFLVAGFQCVNAQVRKEYNCQLPFQTKAEI